MSEITSKNYTHLSIFHNGLVLDLCVEPSNSFGMLFPSIPLGTIINIGSISNLKAKGLIEVKTVYCFGVEYKRYMISEFGQNIFEEYKNDYSK